MIASSSGRGSGGTIVLIHGLLLSHSSWENWVGRYSARGFKVIAPGYPGTDRTVSGDHGV
jgi:pimeloyl-ACP methyl ester carboxylesterase